VNGGGFVSASKVNWNGSPLTTTFVSGTQLTAAITASDIASAGTASVSVVNPTPGGGISNIQFFPVASPVSSPTFADLNTATPNGDVPNSTVAADFNGD
jgi:hypothetical protein